MVLLENGGPVMWLLLVCSLLAGVIFDDDSRYHYLAAELGSIEEEVPLPVLEGSRYLLVEESLS